MAILGPRKVGKTSLLLELERRSSTDRVRFLTLDTLEAAPLSVEFFRAYALRALDRTLGAELGLSLEQLARTPSELRAALQSSQPFARLPVELRAALLELPDRPMDRNFLRFCLELPERLAQALDLFLLVAIDEFQELAAIELERKRLDPFPLL